MVKYLLKMADHSGTSKIVKFFRNSTVFLTGGTGFVGKAMICKLILTCEVSCVYLLVRKKSSKTSRERLTELFESQVFLHLENELPDCIDRIKLIEGDCARGNLGISAHNEELLCKSVDFVIHCAAETSAIESFKSSVEINVLGTKNLIELAGKMVNLKAFLHLSSLGGYFDRDVVDEKFYESNLDYEDCLNLLEIDQVLPMDEHDRTRILGNKWAFYSVTKATAENIFIREQFSVPVAIVRFPFALPSRKEPFAGYTDGFYGPSAAIITSLLDIAPFCPWSNQLIDAIPVNMIVNASLAVTQHSYDEFQKGKESDGNRSQFIYNYSTRTEGCENGLSAQYLLSKWENDHNFKVNLHSNEWTFMLSCIMFGYIPALVIDFFTMFIGEKTDLFRACAALVDVNFRIIRSAFTSNRVNNNNLVNCWKNLSDIDRKLFSFDLNELKWNEYLPVMFDSSEEFIRKLLEEDRNIRLAVLWVPKLRFALKALYFALGLYCVCLIYNWLN